jgi:hypothetical protein
MFTPFKCFRSKVTADDQPVNYHMQSKSRLIEILTQRDAELQRIKVFTHDERLQNNNSHYRECQRLETRYATHLESTLKTISEMHGTNSTLNTEIKSLQSNLAALTASHDGLKTAVNRQAAEINRILSEMQAMKTEITPKTPLDTHTIIRDTEIWLKTMKDYTTDHISFEPLLNPVTLNSGYTVNRDTLARLIASSRADQVHSFACPFSRTTLSADCESRKPKSFAMADLTELCIRMQAAFEEFKAVVVVA